jgi:PilZ domain-containing protein
MIVARVVQDYVTSTFCERRQFRRLPMAVQIELRLKGNTVPIRAETADISLGGCYIEMALTLSVGTPLNIVLWLGHEKLIVDAMIATCHPQFGNGIEFSGLSRDSQLRLQRFLESKSENNQNSLPKNPVDPRQ